MRQQSERHRRAISAQRNDGGDGRERFGKIDPRARHLLPRHEARARRGVRPPRPLQPPLGRRGGRGGGGVCRPKPHRQVVALQPCDLHQSLRRDTQTHGSAAPRPADGPDGGALLVQHRRRTLRGVQGRRAGKGGDAIHGRPRAGMRGMRRQAFQERHSRSEIRGQEYPRHPRNDRERRHSLLRHPRPGENCRTPANARCGGAGLHQIRAARLDALGRRKPARETGVPPGAGAQRAHTLHLRRTHHRPALPRHRAAA